MFGNIFAFKIKETLVHSLKSLLEAPIIELLSVDSTNNYAMRCIDADKAQNGMTIFAEQQTEGKGQRGRKWETTYSDNILMSIILSPNRSIDQQFIFNAAIAVAVAEVLIAENSDWEVKIKWPNDIIINAKKSGGILIENVLRGNSWNWAIVGLGLNVNQSHFDSNLPYATSLKCSSGLHFNKKELQEKIRHNIFLNISNVNFPLELYNQFLFKKNENHLFSINNSFFNARVLGVEEDGQLKLEMSNNSIQYFNHGSINWEWF